MINAILLNLVEATKIANIDSVHVVKNIIINAEPKENDWISSSITIIIAFIAGLIALYQVRSNTIASSRITWIENLRGVISEYCDTIILVGAHQESFFDSKNNGTKDIIEYEKYFNAHSTFNKLGIKIRLYLNSDKPLHKEIIEETKIIEKLLHQPDKKIDKGEIIKNIEVITNASQKLFIQEWKKSKKLFKL